MFAISSVKKNCFDKIRKFIGMYCNLLQFISMANDKSLSFVQGLRV